MDGKEIQEVLKEELKVNSDLGISFVQVGLTIPLIANASGLIALAAFLKEIDFQIFISVTFFTIGSLIGLFVIVYHGLFVHYSHLNLINFILNLDALVKGNAYEKLSIEIQKHMDANTKYLELKRVVFFGNLNYYISIICCVTGIYFVLVFVTGYTFASLIFLIFLYM